MLAISLVQHPCFTYDGSIKAVYTGRADAVNRLNENNLYVIDYTVNIFSQNY